MIRETYQTPSPEEMILGANARQPDVASISDLDPYFISQHHNTQRVSSPCHPTYPHQFRPQGRDPLEKFSGADPEKYAIWRYEIDQKFEDDSFFENNPKQITYARAQLCGDLFIHMSKWKLTTPISDQILDNLFHKIEFFFGAVNLDEIAHSEFIKIKQKPGEKVTQFYKWIAVL